MSSAWEDEQATSAERRRLVEARAGRLPTEPDAFGSRAREAIGKARPLAAGFRRMTGGIRRRAGRLVLAASVWPRRVRRDRRSIVDSGAAPGLPTLDRAVRCVVVGPPGGPAERAARTRGCDVVVVPRLSAPVELGSSELVCIMSATTTPTSPAWLDRLIAAMNDGVVAVAPTLVHPRRRWHEATPFDELVRNRGLRLAVDGGAPILRAREAGAVARLDDGVDTVDAVTGACALVTRQALDHVGGLPPVDDLDAAMIELCARLQDDGGRVAVSRDVLAIDSSPVTGRGDLYEPLASRPEAWRDIVGRHGPRLLRRATDTAGDPGLRIALTIGAPSEKLAPRWGDWHFAGALARALERNGHVVRVQTADHADDLAGRVRDLHVVLRGLRRVPRTPGQRHVLWIISHPDAIDPHECDEADLVLVASARFAEHLRTQTTTPVEVMLQATDHHRFRRVPAQPEHHHDVAVVAKTRDVPRPIVVDAIEAGLRPAIYGTGWEAIVDPTLVVADYVPNDVLPLVYSSVGVLLNDHWEAMRTWGFVSNRLFDALACGTPVISDQMPEIDALFGDAVAAATGPLDLRAHADAILADMPAARARAERGTVVVLAAHTFDHRAEELIELLARYGLVTGAAGGLS